MTATPLADALHAHHVPAPATPPAKPTAAQRKAARATKAEASRAAHTTALDAATARRKAAEAKARPWNHTLREERTCHAGECFGCDGYLWRHTWTHDVTGERLVVTVPLIAADHPAPREGVVLRWEGVIVLRRISGVEAALRAMPSATARVFAADGTLTATWWLEAVEAAT